MHSQSEELKQEMVRLVRARLDVLSTKSFDELATLPCQSSEEIVQQGSKFTLSIWHDVLDSQDHRIVVQVYKPGRLSIGRMYADGFVVNRNNEKRSLTQQEWAPFS